MMGYDSYRLPKKEACRMMYDVGMKLADSLGIKNKPKFETLYKRCIKGA